MTDPKTRRERAIEAAAKEVYQLDPFEEGGEYVDGFQVSPGGKLSWEQALSRDAEFDSVRGMLPITAFAFLAARAAISEYERVMSEDAVTSPLTDESTGGPEGSGPGWEP